MSQVGNRNASAGKRARTDGGRREDDWTCPSCNNVNFSFRTTCNMHNCTQSRPADHNTKSAPKAPQMHPAGYAPGYMGAAAPSSMYLGAPPYGSSLLNGPALSPYNMRFPGGSAYHFDYGSRSIGSPYGSLHMSGPPYSSGSMMGAGSMYGMSPMVDRYGLGLPLAHGGKGPRPGAFPEESSQKKATSAGREDDWACPTCGNLNFAFRTVCNMRKCNTPRPGSQVWWKKLLRGDGKAPHYVKIDWDKWADKDDKEDVDIESERFRWMGSAQLDIYVILVGHDFGGACISYAMEAFPSKDCKSCFCDCSHADG